MVIFYDEKELGPCRTPQLEDNPLSAVYDCLFNIFAATLSIGCHSSSRKLKTRHAVAIVTPYNGTFFSLHTFFYLKFVTDN